MSVAFRVVIADDERDMRQYLEELLDAERPAARDLPHVPLGGVVAGVRSESVPPGKGKQADGRVVRMICTPNQPPHPSAAAVRLPSQGKILFGRRGAPMNLSSFPEYPNPAAACPHLVAYRRDRSGSG